MIFGQFVLINPVITKRSRISATSFVISIFNFLIFLPFIYYEMWQDGSPIWARPQDYEGYLDLYPEDLYQVVGHTPVSTPQQQGRLLTLDTFSTTSNGKFIGDQRFVIVDTIDGSWSYADEQQ